MELSPRQIAIALLSSDVMLRGWDDAEVIRNQPEPITSFYSGRDILEIEGVSSNPLEGFRKWQYMPNFSNIVQWDVQLPIDTCNKVMPALQEIFREIGLEKIPRGGPAKQGKYVETITITEEGAKQQNSSFIAVQYAFHPDDVPTIRNFIDAEKAKQTASSKPGQKFLDGGPKKPGTRSNESDLGLPGK